MYKHLKALEKEGKILRYESNKKKFVKLTELGEDAVKKCFFEMFPSYQTDILLKNFVRYLSSKTKQFLKERYNGVNHIPDKHLFSLNENLREMYETKLREFCRDAENLQIEVKYDEN